jgi:hypothetical protein
VAGGTPCTASPRPSPSPPWRRCCWPSGQLDAAAAKRLFEVARAYRSKKWHDSALLVLREALPHDRDVARAEIAAVEKARGGAPPAAGPEPSKTAIDALRIEWMNGEWKRRNGVLLSPAPQQKGYSSDLMTSATHGDQRIGVTVRYGDRDAMAALLFGATGNDYFIYEIISYTGDPVVTLVLYQWAGGKLTMLEEQPVDGTKVREEHRLEVQVRADDVDCLLDGVVRIRAKCPTVPHGKVGFFVSAATGFGGPVEFRDFVLADLPVKPLSPEEQAAAEREARAAALRQGVLAKLAAAEQELGQKRPEAALAQLLRARTQRTEIEAGKVRDDLEKSVQRLTAKADPLQARWQKARAETAAALAALAPRYAARQWYAAAGRVLERAAALDPVHAAAAAAMVEQQAARQREAAAVAAAREVQANAALVEWFADGTRPFGDRGALWQVSAAEGAVTPPLREGAWLITDRAALPAAKCSVQFQLAPARIAGIVFGWRGPHDHCAASLRWRDGKLLFAIRRWRETRWDDLASVAFADPVATAPGEPLPWRDLEVEYGPTSIVARCGGQELKVTPAEPFPGGRIGLVARAEQPTEDTLRFRAFRAPPVPATEK